jgi:hypothetical protein
VLCSGLCQAACTRHIARHTTQTPGQSSGHWHSRQPIEIICITLVKMTHSGVTAAHPTTGTLPPSQAALSADSALLHVTAKLTNGPTPPYATCLLASYLSSQHAAASLSHAITPGPLRCAVLACQPSAGHIALQSQRTPMYQPPITCTSGLS